ncbi:MULTISPECIES: GNAT family protein [unclassified Streptomyces]|uniref:GNAT family N-acetyltransferase n=1 Tax=unclassified Streptomyces TaxID=2593676 RepID=UPI0033E8AE36
MIDSSYLAEGPRVAIRRLSRSDFAEIHALREESAPMLARWLGVRENTREAFDSSLDRFEQPTREGLVICLTGTGQIVGGVNINDIVRGTLQSGVLGYTAYASTAGRGYMTEGLGLVVRFAFDELGLHRLEANIQPDNLPSLKLVERLGFRREGYSPAFQHINGEWCDHERWALTAQ